MSIERNIVYRGLEPSEAVSERIQEHINHLAGHFPRIRRVDVVLTLVSHHNGNQSNYRVVIEADVPGGRMVVGHEPAPSVRENAYLALTAAFDAVAQKLARHESRVRRETKRHDSPLEKGEVMRLFSYEGFGFIRTDEGREIYFNENSVLNQGFRTMAIGTPVRFCEEAGDNGPQASTVKIHRHRAGARAMREARLATQRDSYSAGVHP